MCIRDSLTLARRHALIAGRIVFSDTVFVTLFLTAVETAISGVYKCAWHWWGHHLLDTVVLAVAVGLFSLYGSVS